MLICRTLFLYKDVTPWETVVRDQAEIANVLYVIVPILLACCPLSPYHPLPLPRLPHIYNTPTGKYRFSINRVISGVEYYLQVLMLERLMMF